MPHPPLISFDRIWAMREDDFQIMQSTLRTITGRFPSTADPAALEFRTAESGSSLFQRFGRIAIIDIAGPITKSRSMMSRFMGGTSALNVRDAVNAAAASNDCDCILLRVDSPGGTIFGVSDAADAVFRARQSKRVIAFIEDLGASAAYWIASQADRVIANRTAIVGSIGTYLVAYDFSKLLEGFGVKAYVIKAGEHKGDGAFGAEITASMRKEWQREVNDLNAHFLAAVGRGRGMEMSRVKTIADGRVHIGRKAIPVGLIDEVNTLEGVIRTMQQGTDGPNPESFRASYPEPGVKASDAA